MYCKMADLSEKNVLITGGALGMARSLAGLFFKEGARVAIVDIREEDLEKTQSELACLGISRPMYAIFPIRIRFTSLRR